MSANLVPYMSYWGVKKIDSFIINLHKLSSYYLRKNFGEVHFITDSKSLPYFKDIKWSSVSTELDILDKKYSPVWSLGKLYVYKILAEKNIPFIHVDYDVILWEGLPEKFKNSKLIAQNYENKNPQTYEKYHIEDFLKLCPDLDILQATDKNINAVNVGIFGGTDFNFIKQYSDSAINFIYNKKNEDFWLNNDFFEDWTKACIAEQYYLSYLLKLQYKNIDLFFEKKGDLSIKDKGAYWLDIYYNNFNFCIDDTDYPYTHFMDSKKRPDIQDKIKKMVKKLKL